MTARKELIAMKISVVIPCRNEKQHIQDFLDSLLAQQLEPDWEMEILVADGMSADGTREILGVYAARVPIVRVIDNPGRIVSTGLNAAIQEAAGEVIIRMDAHTTYAADYIRACVKTLKTTGAENVGGPWVAVGRGTIGKAIAAAQQSPFCTGGGKAHDPQHEGEVDTVYLGCWRRSVFEIAGLFDPALVRNQDDEFNFRLRRQGGRIWQSPQIKSSYVPRGSLVALFRQYMQYGYWKVAVIRKHRGMASWRHAVPPLFVGSILLGGIVIAAAAALRISTIAVWIGSALGTGLLVYVLACVGAAVRFARSLEMGALLLLPAVIALQHFAYGSGFLSGILDSLRAHSARVVPSEAFTGLTR
jgi:glycosyltransferase involved in cell wall biosynthesis